MTLFSEILKLIMVNWEAIYECEVYECEDGRDVDWWQKRAALAEESQALTHFMVFDDDKIIEVSS